MATNTTVLPMCITGDTLPDMRKVSVRDLRNKGGQVLKRVARGETVIVTMDGEPIAELRPIRRRGVPIDELIEQWRKLPNIDPAKLRADIDGLFDTSL